MHLPDQALLKEKFTITLPDGTVWQGEMYGTRSREGGRAILVRSGPAILWTSGECYDLGNATFRLKKWLEQQIVQRQTVPTCDVCKEPAEGGQSTADTVLCPACIKKSKVAGVYVGVGEPDVKPFGRVENGDRRVDGGARADNAKDTTRGPI